MIYCKELNKSFNTNTELVKALKENKEFIIKAKKANTYLSIEKSINSVVSNNLKTSHEFIKSYGTNKSIDLDENYHYFVVNSSGILDSYNDLHIDGNWEKSVKEQQGKNYLIYDHKLTRDNIIAMKEDIEMFTSYVPFKSLNKPYEGNGYCLVYKVAKDKIKDNWFKENLNGQYNFEASVRMVYMDIELAIQEKSEDYKQENATYDKYIDQIANKEEFDNIPYFWAVKQAKNVMESSLVMFGACSATGELKENEIKEPSNDTQNKIEAVKKHTSKSNYLLI